MPSVCVDTRIEIDPRLNKLAELLGSKESAVGAVVIAARTAFPYWKYYHPVPAFIWHTQVEAGDKLIEAGFAERVADGSVMLKDMRDVVAYEADAERLSKNYI